MADPVASGVRYYFLSFGELGLMNLDQRARSFGTHDGSFHADEVTACALCLFFDLIDRDKVVRSRDVDVLKRCEFVCDVGGIYCSHEKRFDHHQVDYEGELSSAGMVLRYLLDQGHLTRRAFEHLDRFLVHGIDAIDNGKINLPYGISTFSDLIAQFVPLNPLEEEPCNRAFFEAVDLAFAQIGRLLRKFTYIEECRHLIKDEMDKGEEVLIFDRAMPWVETFFDLGGEVHRAKFVIMPKGEHWKLRGIPPSYDRLMEVRVSQPREWAGLMDRELQACTGIDGAIFCHKARFISIWLTREDALSALRSFFAFP